MVNMNRFLLARIVFFSYLILLLLKYRDGSLLFQQSYPPFVSPNLNITYWLFLYTNSNEIIFTSTILKYIVDIILFVSCILCIIKPKSNIFPITFTITLWLYQFLYYSIIACHPFAIGLLFPCIPFIFKNDLKFFFVYNFGRYFLCGLYFLAGLLKITNKGIFNIQQMSFSLKTSVSDYMYYNSDLLNVKAMSFLIENYRVSYFLFLCAAILELMFLIGFITKKYDYHLMFLFLLFHFANYIILDLPFTNHIIILIFFIPLKPFTKNVICKKIAIKS